jgi:hypothetical protein
MFRMQFQAADRSKLPERSSVARLPTDSVAFEFLAHDAEGAPLVVTARFWIASDSAERRRPSRINFHLLTDRHQELEILPSGSYRCAETLKPVRASSTKFAWPNLCSLAQRAMLGDPKPGEDCRFADHCAYQELCRCALDSPDGRSSDGAGPTD